MRWAEEKYVKLFVRDTPTWRSWPWQARAVAPLLMRALEPDGSLAVGRLEPTAAVAAVVLLPEDVVAPGVAAMTDDGTLELRDGRLWWPHFEAAQESRKSEALRAREYRARGRRQQEADNTQEDGRHTPSRAVTRRHTPSHAVTQRHTPSPSSPAQPSPAQPSPATTSSAPPQKQTGPKGKTAAQESDPRHAWLVKALCDVYELKRGVAYPFTPRQAATVMSLLSVRPASVSADEWPLRLEAAWRRALDSRFPGCSTLEDFGRQLPKHLGTGPPEAAPRPRDAPQVYPEGEVKLGAP